MSKKLIFFSFLVVFGALNAFAGNSQNSVFPEFNVNFTNFANFKGEASLSADVSNFNSTNAVTINGNGFERFEQISLTVTQFDDSSKQAVELGNWIVFADINGSFSTQWQNISAHKTNNFTVRGEAKSASAETNFSPSQLAPAANLDQCANGPFSNPTSCAGSNWQNGNVGQSQGHYYEGDSIPYRIKLSDLPTGAGNPHSITIEWDTTQQGKHAIDYITSYNRTEVVGNNPCSGVVPACGPATTFPIPLDPNVSGAGVTQIGGQVLTMWGGTITGVSAYTLSGSYAGNSSTRITINFIANQSNPVLAWGGHIADRQDWATMGGSASNIPGSPYHTRLIDLNGSGGNQDRSLSNVAVRLNSKIVIVKQASPESGQPFGFTATGLAPANFILFDDGVDNDATPNNISFNNLLAPLGSGTFSVTENTNLGFYVLTGITCSVSAGGTSTFSTAPLINRTATVTLQYGDTVTCTFNNTVTTAANASVRGRTLDASGNPLRGTLVTIQNSSTGETRSAYTNSFGFYEFNELAVGDLYVVTVSNKRYAFQQNARTLFLNEAVEDFDFTAQE